MIRRLGAILPEFVKKPLRSVREYVLYGGIARFCPVCGKSSRRFYQHGIVPREDARCARCGALERHRLLWLYLANRTNLFDGNPKKMLHVAPEPCFEPRFRKRLGDDYITADLFHPLAMVKMDITDIKYPDQSFDVMYCSHVLEHVQDDRRAMREFHRVLKKTGWVILLVPITEDVTFEDPSIVEPKERLEAFGQEDHVRRYGRDYGDRLRDAGFRVEITQVKDLVNAEDATRMGLTRATGEIYCCTK
jgi:SAM-dependent methyltransferase